MPNPHKLTILTELREAAGLTLTQMARRCGLTGKQSRLTAGAWERGEYAPDERRRRTKFIGYLWDDLGLRKEPARFEQLWHVLEEEWGWAAVTDAEWRAFTSTPRATHRSAAETPNNRAATPFQAPGVAAHFVGRQAELDALTTLLKPDDAPSRHQRPIVVALVGMGGIGKSTLAARLAHLLRPHFGDGVLWGAAATGSALDILQSWAKAYGYDFSGLSDVENRAASLRSVLTQKHALLVLDDVTSVEQMRPLLPGCATCPVLLTTRNEEVARGLGAQVVRIAELAPADGVQLLTHILGTARLGREPDAAQRICELLHHLPLAVEIAAQFLVARPRRKLAQWVDHLQQEQNRLDLRVSDRDVRTSFALSWRGLAQAQRVVFAHMAVFGGRAFTSQALAAVVEPMLKLDLLGTVEVLETLAAFSLVRDVGEAADESDQRYQQHPLLADFAREKLTEICTMAQHNEMAPFAQMATHYLTFAQQHQHAPIQLEPEWDNMMAGMGAAHELAQWQMVLDYADALTEPWFARGRYADAIRGYAQAVQVARTFMHESQLCVYLTKWGYILTEQSAHSEAEPLLREALAISQEAGYYQTQCEALFHLSRIELDRTNYEEGDELLTLCLAIREEIGDFAGQAAVLQMLGLFAYRIGDYERAESFALDALAIVADTEEFATQIRILRLLVDIAFQRGNYTLAHKYALQNVQVAEKLNYQSEIAETLYSLAMVNRSLGHLKQATSCLALCRPLFEKTGNRAFVYAVLFEHGMIYKELGDHKHAIEKLEECLLIIEELRDYYNKVIALLHMGDLYSLVGSHERANGIYTDGFDLAREIHHPRSEQFQHRLSKTEHAMAI